MADKKKLLNFHELNLGKNEVSMSELEKLAEQGDQTAMHKLIKLYSPAPTIASNQPERNQTQAFKWVKRLEELGDWQARRWLADCYFSGEHVEERDWDKAIALLKKNAMQGDGRAWVRLAYYYSHGNGVEKDFIQAIEWLKKIAEYEDSKMDCDNFLPHRSFEIEQALGESHQVCPELSFSYEEPRYKLAECYFQGGYGIEKNLNEAVEWLEKAIEWPKKTYDENCRAQLKLGECYLQGGYGLEQNYTKAAEWFEKAADCHEQCAYSRNAQHKLALCFCLGRGVIQDYNRAIEWFNKSLKKMVGKYRWGIPAELVRAQAESGVCHYRVGKSDEALKLFEESSTQDDAIANLWLAYLNQLENDKIKEKINYVPNWFGSRLSVFCELSENERLSEEIDQRTQKIAEYLRNAAVGFAFQNDDNSYFDADMMSFVFPEEVIRFLKEIDKQNQLVKIILAFYHRGRNEQQTHLEFLKKLPDDMLANYLLGKHYQDSIPFDAIKYFDKVDALKESFVAREYSVNTQQLLAYLAKSAKEGLTNIKHKEEIEKKNKRLDDANHRMQKLVEQFTHSLGNIIFPDTIYQVAERLKNKPECRKDVLLLHEAYHSEIIIKLQGELLRQRYANTNPERFRQFIRSCRRTSNHADKTKSIEDILDYAASRVAARFLNQHYAGLNSIRDNILSKKNVSLNTLKQKFEDDILLNKSLRPIAWINQNLRPIKITEISPLWKKVFILSESHAEALLFGYFSEILFNAFKYANHDKDEFLTLVFDEKNIDDKMYLTCSWQNPVKDKSPSMLGTGKGLDAIQEDLKQLNDVENPKESLLISQQKNQFQVILYFKKDLLVNELPSLKIKRKANVE